MQTMTSKTKQSIATAIVSKTTSVFPNTMEKLKTS
jgi:hypothetical protein